MDNLFDLAGQHAVVTGGKGRLGPIWVDTLEKAGAKVHIYDLPDWDVTNQTQAYFYAVQLAEQNIYPTIIVNNAAIDNPPGSEASFWGNLKTILDVNVRGCANMAEAFIPRMINTNSGGVFINIGSIMGNIGADWRNYPEDFEKPVAYNLSKAALIQMSRSITTQYGRYNIRSVTMSFGPYDAGLSEDFKEKFMKNVPLGRPISEQSIRTSLLYAICCPELAGTQVLVDAGYTSW